MCRQSSLCYDFLIYQGSTTELIPEHLGTYGLGGSVVSKLTEHIDKPNFRIYFDNSFSNYNLLQYLRNKNIFARCTARLDRFTSPPFSSDKVMKQKGRDASEGTVRKEERVITKWFDNKSVIIASIL